jgi:hypothetical protein
MCCCVCASEQNGCWSARGRALPVTVTGRSFYAYLHGSGMHTEPEGAGTYLCSLCQEFSCKDCSLHNAMHTSTSLAVVKGSSHNVT